MMNNIQIQWKEKNKQGVLSLFNCDFYDYQKRIYFLYCLSHIVISELQFYLIISNLKQRAIKGRILPKPERVLMIVKRLSKRSVKNGYYRVCN